MSGRKVGLGCGRWFVLGMEGDRSQDEPGVNILEECLAHLCGEC